jgi:hypothetical protein
MKAVDWDKNQFTAAIFLLKAATVKELQNDYKGATDLYERIKKDYPQSTEARDVDRYIARASQLSAKG